MAIEYERGSDGGWHLRFERRADGWPLCPSCGQDELWSPFTPLTEAQRTLVNYLLEKLHCYRCAFVVPPGEALVGFMSRGGQA